MLTLLAALQVAVMSEAASSATPVPICEVVKASAEAEPSPGVDDESDFNLSCGERSMDLGRLESFRTGFNPQMGSTLLVLSSRDETRVLLVSPVGDGDLHVDDLTRELTALTGRYIEAGLMGITIDLSRFANDGTVAVSTDPISGDRETASLSLLPYAVLALSQSESTLEGAQ